MNRLKNEYHELKKLYEESRDEKYLYRQYCLDHFFEVGVNIYMDILKYCKDTNVKGIIDIGCAMGYQSEIFLVNDIDCIGIDNRSDYFYNSDKFIYIKNKYPCKIIKNDYLGVSSLCLSWNCYLDNGLNTLNSQFKALSRDFKKCLIYGQKSNMGYANKYFSNVMCIEGSMYELSN